MTMSFDLPALGHAIIDAVADRAATIAGQLVSPVSPISICAAAAALSVSIALVLGSRRRARPVPLKVMARALLPMRMRRSRTARLDFWLYVFNTTLFLALFSWAVVSQSWVKAALLAPFGPLDASLLSGPAALALSTVVLFLAAELASYITHWLSHRVPALWELHKVHHSAEVLTYLTVFRVHPIEGVMYANITALVMGATGAVLTLALGADSHGYVANGSNVIALAGLYLVKHLQHTEFWVMAPGPLRKLIHSPAHHQIHHSEDPTHYGKNLGALLTVWDWMFGTLLTPDAKRPALTFGLAGEEPNHETFSDAMTRPILALAPVVSRRRPVAEQA